MKPQKFDVVIIGAGPAGAIAASMLVQRGRKVLVLEKEHFPRFSIGESLLPQCMEYIAAAGLMDVLDQQASERGFQFKNGAAFSKNGNSTFFDFTEKFSPGPGTTFQVKRAAFDKLLADGAAEYGAVIRYGHQVIDVDFNSAVKSIHVKDESSHVYHIQARFVLDASGFGRVLPRLLGLDRVSSQPDRQAVFTHIQDNICDPHFDRNKILISVHPQHQDIWYWLIPFADGTSSLGVVGKPHQLNIADNDLTILQEFIAQSDNLSVLLAQSRYQQSARQLTGYSASVEKMHGDGFALLGNAGEFLDPVFSSGVTIAMHSAWLISPLVDQFLDGHTVDFSNEFSQPLQRGINCFRTFVNGWYTGEFQTIIFSPQQQPVVRSMISSILAGYAWDVENPYVTQSERRFKTLYQLCAEQF